MTSDYAKWTAITWLRNGQELDVAIMFRTLRKIGIRIYSWTREAAGYRLQLKSEQPIERMATRLQEWIKREWIWAGKHSIVAMGPGHGEVPFDRVYEFDIEKIQGQDVTFDVNEKLY